jgi:SAM-dependent methyltransferase
VSTVDGEEWSDFTLPEFSFSDFPPGSRVLDVGCGAGDQLGMLRQAGVDAIGVEPRRELVDALVAKGYDVRCGKAEQLPISDGSCDGLICKVVVPYTDERRAIGEWARVLRPGAAARVTYHGAGYYIRYLVDGPGVMLRIYALRSLVNTWWYAATDQRLPGFIGDTLYQSSKRLAEYYRDFGLTLERVSPSPSYRGKPVFIYHELRRLDKPAR